MIDELDVKIFADGADLDGILALAADKRIAGFTTNPTLMWKAGLTDYEEFAKRLLERITAHPISFEVFADDADEMRRQALKIAHWGDNVYVKIPVTTTKGESMAPLVRELSEAWREGQRHRAVHDRAGRADHRRGQGRRAVLHLGVRRADRRRRDRSGADHGPSRADHARRSAVGADLGLAA